jgi:hypothetical protein
VLPHQSESNKRSFKKEEKVFLRKEKTKNKNRKKNGLLLYV